MDDLGKILPGLIRDMVIALGGTGLGAGVTDANGWVALGGAAVVLVGAVWTILHRKAVAEAVK